MTFLFYWLLKNGYECIEDKKARKDKTFTCLLSDTGLFYTIEIYFTVKGKKINKVTLIDSLKILNFSVEKIAKDYGISTWSSLPINPELASKVDAGCIEYFEGNWLDNMIEMIEKIEK